jgi:hypothetical protein
MGLTDASQNMVFSDFETWEDDILWPGLETRYQPERSRKSKDKGLSVKSCKVRTLALRQDVKEATVVSTKTLTSNINVKSKKKHIEIQLPKGTQYQAGDYLAVLPINPYEVVRRALRRFRLPMDAHLEVLSGTPTALPSSTLLSAMDVLSSYVELSQPATKRVRKRIGKHTCGIILTRRDRTFLVLLKLRPMLRLKLLSLCYPRKVMLRKSATSVYQLWKSWNGIPLSIYLSGTSCRCCHPYEFDNSKNPIAVSLHPLLTFLFQLHLFISLVGSISRDNNLLGAQRARFFRPWHISRRRHLLPRFSS